MFFILSKLLWAIVAPANALFLLLVAGAVLLWTRWAAWGRRLATAVAGMALMIMILPIGDWLLVPLEDRFPIVSAPPDRVDGIVVLGGSHNQQVAAARGQAALNDAAERMTTFIALAQRYPNARLVVTAGSGRLTNQEIKEAISVRLLFDQLGFDVRRVTIIEESRNTFEAARLSFTRLNPKVHESWLLVTSASHMPRSVGAFRRLGWNVVAFPVDFKTAGAHERVTGFDFVEQLRLVNRGLKEWVGLTMYYLMGWTSEWFPGPAAGS